MSHPKLPLANPQQRIPRTEAVVESEGCCRKCHQWAVLGNGLCVGCHDKLCDRQQWHGHKFGHRVSNKKAG